MLLFKVIGSTDSLPMFNDVSTWTHCSVHIKFKLTECHFYYVHHSYGINRQSGSLMRMDYQAKLKQWLQENRGFVSLWRKLEQKKVTTKE